MVAAAVAQLPAVWVVLGLVVALFGLLPRWVTAAWALLVGFLLLGELGPLFGLPGVSWTCRRTPTCPDFPVAR